MGLKKKNMARRGSIKIGYWGFGGVWGIERGVGEEVGRRRNIPKISQTLRAGERPASEGKIGK